ncbi:hypothetical protein XH99_01455 [Bradyrhizobium nanningense]|uniref:Uncharacterized protein n=1 Tax=Bradyrhizobium nanningense TaxID=1325118 RepID=A0A4Q0SG68_9BRAD|nr:hypothetical protein [Bradyrhizobium nanningense]RXH23974.1 hypothetical protein XH84_33350 [Bradyrhizobium nanningense]RXH38435.1 hypothetical protein XH99_01455 [Bradyrhizobium nanningense]
MILPHQRPWTQLDEDAAVPHKLDAIGDLEQSLRAAVAGSARGRAAAYFIVRFDTLVETSRPAAGGAQQGP